MFRDILEKVESDSDYNGLRVYGEDLNVSLRIGKHNDLMDLKYDGGGMKSKIRSVENVKNEYQEEDWTKIEKMYDKIFKEASADITKLVAKFEKEMDGILKDTAKKTEKF